MKKTIYIIVGGLAILVVVVVVLFGGGSEEAQPEAVAATLSDRLILMQGGQGLGLGKVEIETLIERSNFPWGNYSQIYVGDLSPENLTAFREVLGEYESSGVDLSRDAFRVTQGDTAIFFLPSAEDMKNTGWSAMPAAASQKILFALILEEGMPHVAIQKTSPGPNFQTTFLEYQAAVEDGLVNDVTAPGYAVALQKAFDLDMRALDIAESEKVFAFSLSALSTVVTSNEIIARDAMTTVKEVAADAMDTTENVANNSVEQSHETARSANSNQVTIAVAAFLGIVGIVALLRRGSVEKKKEARRGEIREQIKELETELDSI